MLYVTRIRQGGGLSDAINLPDELAAFADVIDPEEAAEGLSGVKAPAPADVARARALNKRFADHKKLLQEGDERNNVTYKVFCGGKNGIMVKKYVDNCAVEQKPIGVGASGLLRFEKIHGISFNKFESASNSEIESALRFHLGKMKSAVPPKKGKSTPKSGSGASATVKAATAKAKAAADAAKTEVKKAEQEIEDIKEEAAAGEITQTKAKAEIKKQTKKIEKAETKAEEAVEKAEEIVEKAADAGEVSDEAAEKAMADLARIEELLNF